MSNTFFYTAGFKSRLALIICSIDFCLTIPSATLAAGMFLTTASSQTKLSACSADESFKGLATKLYE